MNERWKKIKGWPLYEISDCGNVRSWKPHYLSKTKRRASPLPRKSVKMANGYLGLNFVDGNYTKYKKTQFFFVHRLVASHFVSGDRSLHVAHIDGSRDNNHFSNLKWVSRRENASHMIKHGTKQEGESHASAKVCDRAVGAILYFAKAGMPYSELAHIFNISIITVSDYVRGRSRKNVINRQGR